MRTIARKYTLQAAQRTGNWRSLCAGTPEDFAGLESFSFAEMTIPDDWRHQGLDCVFGFSNSDAVSAALVPTKETSLWKKAV